MEWETRVRNSLWIIPIIIDWANKVASNVVANATFILPVGSEAFSQIVTVVDPFHDCDFESACVITMSVIGT
jgi:hypothetical protein